MCASGVRLSVIHLVTFKTLQCRRFLTMPAPLCRTPSGKVSSLGTGARKQISIEIITAMPALAAMRADARVAPADLRFILERIQGSPNNIRENLYSAAAGMRVGGGMLHLSCEGAQAHFACCPALHAHCVHHMPSTLGTSLRSSGPCIAPFRAAILHRDFPGEHTVLLSSCRHRGRGHARQGEGAGGRHPGVCRPDRLRQVFRCARARRRRPWRQANPGVRQLFRVLGAGDSGAVLLPRQFDANGV